MKKVTVLERSRDFELNSQKKTMVFKVTWEQYKTFLIVDKRRKTKNLQFEKSRFDTLARFFSGLEWNTENFRKFLAGIHAEGKSQGTINKYTTLGKHIDEYFGVSQTAHFKTKVEKIPKVREVLTAEQILQLANFKYPYKKYKDVLNQRQQALIMLLGTTGCRIGEALELKWENIYRGEYKSVEFIDTKNGDDREVWIDDDLFELIDALPKESDFVFSSSRGGILSSNDVNQDLKKRAEKLGIKIRIYNHLFRHSWATTMKKIGAVSDTDICEIAGWKDPKMLLRYGNHKMDYYRKKMSLHPLLQNKISWKERVTSIEKYVMQYFDPTKHEIKTEVVEGEFVLRVNLKTT